MYKYWYRLENLDESSLLYDALEFSKAIDGCNNCWYTSLPKIFELLKIPLESSANMKLTTFTKKKNTKVRKQKYLEEWSSLRENFSIWKQATYTKIKCNFGIEKYLNTVNCAYRRDVARLWILSHRLYIEDGRYTKKKTGLIFYALNVCLVF